MEDGKSLVDKAPAGRLTTSLLGCVMVRDRAGGLGVVGSNPAAPTILLIESYRYEAVSEH
jgi:hypothetical protein